MHRGWGAAALIALGAIACGKSKSDGEDAGTAAASQDLAHQLADAVCGALASCCASAGYGYDPNACADQELMQWAYSFADLRRPNVRLDEDAFAACKQGLAAREAMCAGDAAVIDGGVDSPTSPCGRLLVGSVPAGQPCDVTAQCAHDPATQTATCAVDLADPSSPTFGQSYCLVTDLAQPPGAPCSGSLPESPANPRSSQCDETRGSCVLPSPGAPNGVCTVFLAAGSACYPSQTEPSCPPDAPCETSLGSQPTCTPLPTLGQSCNGVRCADAFYCDATSMQCAVKKAPGETCHAYDECVANSFCAGIIAPDGGLRDGVCYVTPTISPWDATPRSCGFGPLDYGPEDAGIPLQSP